MKHLFFFGFLFILRLTVQAQEASSQSQKLQSYLHDYFSETGIRILILENDISGLYIPEGKITWSELPDFLVEDTEFSYFNFQNQYLIIFPTSI